MILREGGKKEKKEGGREGRREGGREERRGEKEEELASYKDTNPVRSGLHLFQSLLQRPQKVEIGSLQI